MQGLIWAGAMVSLVGLAALIWCIARVWRARKAGLGDAEMRLVLQKIVPINTGALFLSMTGLVMVVVGIILG